MDALVALEIVVPIEALRTLVALERPIVGRLLLLVVMVLVVSRMVMMMLLLLLLSSDADAHAAVHVLHACGVAAVEARYHRRGHASY